MNKNNRSTAQLYFTLMRADLHGHFPLYLRMALIFTNLPKGSGFLTMCTVGNL